MALVLPSATRQLGQNPGHAFLHRVVAVDEASPEQSLVVKSAGQVTIAQRLGIGADAPSALLLYVEEDRVPSGTVGLGPSDSVALFQWIPTGFPNNAAAFTIQGYYGNDTNVSSATKHGGGVFGAYIDTSSGALSLGIGCEGYSLGKGSSQYAAVIGHVLYQHATTNSAGVCASFMAAADITTLDGTTPLASGFVVQYYAPAIVGGGAGTKFSFYGVDPLKVTESIQSWNTGNSKYISTSHDSTNGNVTVSSGALILTAGSGSGMLLSGLFFAPLSAGTCSLGASGFEFSDLWMSGKVSKYSNIAAVGWGVPAIYGTGRSTAQTGAVASVATYTVGASDGSFLITANILVTASTNHSFTATVTYTDEGNTSRTLTLNFSLTNGTIGTSIANAAGAVPYVGIPVQIRCKAATSITIATTGTFTSVTYNVEATIAQVK